MVEVGSLSIKGKLDVDNIQRGQRIISRGFENIKQKTQSTFGSMNLLAKSTKGLGNALSSIGTAAAGGLTLLAGLAPVLAGDFAKIKVETFKLSQILGAEMKPALDSVVSAYSSFTNFLSQDTGMSNFTKDLILLTGAGGALSLLGGKLLGIKNLGKIVIPIAISYGIIKASSDVEEYVGGATGSETAGSIAGGAIAGLGGGIAGGVVSASLFGATLPGIIIGSLLAGAPGAFKAGGNMADKIAEALGIDTSGPSLYEYIRDSILNDVDSSGE